MLKSIRLKNYKGFEDTGEIEIRPITIFFGKNSSGKSSLCKFFPVLRDGLRNPEKPFPLISKENVRLSYKYEDLFLNRTKTGLEFDIVFDSNRHLNASFLIEGDSFLTLRNSISGHAGGGESGRATASFTIRRAGAPTTPYPAFFPSLIFRKNDGDDELIKEISFNVNFIGPIRSEAPDFLFKTDISAVDSKDSKGKFAYLELVRSYVKKTPLLYEVGNWFDKKMDGHRIDINENVNIFDAVSPVVKKNDASVLLSDVGEGITQALPIIVQSFIDSPNTITVLEQPALHLHPAKHADIAERLAQSSKETGQRYVIESHSHNLLLGFRRLVANPDSGFNPEDIVIYYLDSRKTPFKVKKITIDENGSLSDWPMGVFEEGFELIRAINAKK